MRHPVRHIFEHDPEALRAWCADHGMPGYRADQILTWVYRRGVCDPAAMTDLSKADRAALARGMIFSSGRIVRHQSATDGTEKLLVEWDEPEADRAGLRDRAAAGGPAGDANPDAPGAGHGAVSPAGRDATPLPVVGAAPPRTECVMIPSLDPSGPRRTACISSQVGCPVGCRFCASGVGGLEGSLSAGRIVEQVWLLNRLVAGSADGPGSHPTGAPVETEGRPRRPRITHVVFMGMGEPLANLGPVLRAVRTLAAPWGLGLSARRITISTVGLPKAIDRLAAELDLPVTLALSLHAPTDEIRRELIPWAEYTTIRELLAACQRWFDKTGREITLEYTLLRGVNDRPDDAGELARVARSIRANVNLIRYNEVDGMPFRRPRDADVRVFQETLRAAGVNTHVRRSRGRDIAAACGQLRHDARRPA